MIELSNVEKLIVKQAFFNAVADDLKTRDPDNLRGQVDEAMKDAYRDNPMAGKSYDLKLMGQKVGTYSLTVSKGKPQRVETTLQVEDRDEFMAWAEENGYVEKVADMDAIISDFARDGVIPNGCAPVETVIPEVVGGEITRTTVKVDEAEVARVLGPQLETMAYALLEGGIDG